MLLETQTPEAISEQARLLISRWRRESLKTERFEHADRVVEIIAKDVNQPLPVISLTCANYETYMMNGQRRPTLHRELIWTDRGLRKGYVLCHEEIPVRQNQLQTVCQRPINHLIILVDLGMAETLLSPLNPRVAELNGAGIQEDIDQILNHNAQMMQRLIDSGSQNAQVVTRVKRLTHLIPDSFYSQWKTWNQVLRQNLDKNHFLSGKIRRDLEKDAAYYRYAWGLTSQEELYKRVIDQQYGLTGVIGDWLHIFYNQVFNGCLSSKADLIMLDTIPGPSNPAHGEFITYNADRPDGVIRPKTPIIRPFHNLVLLSDPAVIPPYINKPINQLIEEANEF
jgi:hypothetical protein